MHPAFGDANECRLGLDGKALPPQPALLDGNGWNTAPANSGSLAFPPSPMSPPIWQQQQHPISNPSSCRQTSSASLLPSRQICVARFTYTACQPDELTIQRGDRVCVLEKSSDGWWHGVLVPSSQFAVEGGQQEQQQAGWFPSNYVTVELCQSLSKISLG